MAQRRTVTGWSLIRGSAWALALGAGWWLTGCYTLPTKEEAAWIEYAPPPPISADVPRPQRNLQVFDWAWSTVNAYYYDTGFHGVDWAAARARHRSAAEAAPDDDRLYEVINALLGELKDGHTRAGSPHAVAEKRERRWVGLGLEYAPFKDAQDDVVVVSVWPHGPAAQAKVRRGWILKTCNGQGAKAFLNGRQFEEGQKVSCVLRNRRNQVRPIELVARSVYLPPVREAYKLDQNCVYLRFDEFKYADARWLYRQLLIFWNSPLMVIDLRYNTGGDVFCLEYMTGLFLPDGQVLGTAVKQGVTPRPITSRRPSFTPYYEGRVALIVSASTSSAAEIFANAMRSGYHSLIVGQKTAGHVLNAYQGVLPDGGELSFSIRDFLAPDGRRLEGRGVEPDARVIYHINDLRAGRDPGIDSALRALYSQPAEPAS